MSNSISFSSRCVVTVSHPAGIYAVHGARLVIYLALVTH